MQGNMKKSNWAGFLGPIIGLSFVLFAILLAPDFSWESDALSDLGNWFRTDIGPNPFVRAFVFNAGLVIAGVLIIYFASSIISQIRDIGIRIALLSIAVDGLFLAGVGIFTENVPFGHVITALGFFITIPISLALIGIAFLLRPSTRWFGVVSLLLAVLAILLFREWTSLAIWEYVMALISIAGVILLNVMDMMGLMDPLK